MRLRLIIALCALAAVFLVPTRSGHAQPATLLVLEWPLDGGSLAPIDQLLVVQGQRSLGLLRRGSSIWLPLSFTPPHGLSLIQLQTRDGDGVIDLQLQASPWGIRLLPVSREPPCGGVELRTPAGPLLQRPSRGVWYLPLLMARKEGGSCPPRDRSWGPRGGTIRIRFSSEPAGATVYLPEATGLLFRQQEWVPKGQTPITWNGEFRLGETTTVIFRKPGFLDCASTFRVEATSSGIEVASDAGRHPMIAAAPESEVPLVRCQLERPSLLFPARQ